MVNNSTNTSKTNNHLKSLNTTYTNVYDDFDADHSLGEACAMVQPINGFPSLRILKFFQPQYRYKQAITNPARIRVHSIKPYVIPKMNYMYNIDMDSAIAG